MKKHTRSTALIFTGLSVTLFALVALIATASSPATDLPPLPTRAADFVSLPDTVAVADSLPPLAEAAGPAGAGESMPLPEMPVIQPEAPAAPLPVAQVESSAMRTPVPAVEPVVIDVPQQPVPDQVVIRFDPAATEQERQAYIASIGGTVVQDIATLNTVVVSVPDAQATQAAPPSAIVAQSEPDYFVSALLAVPPSDPYYPQQWALPVIGAPDAWLEMPADAPKVTVAVIDSGVCADHPDLAGRVLPGWDFVENDPEPQDAFGHGCGVAGIIAANIDDGIGMAGVAPNAMILPLRVLDASGIGMYSNVAAAIVRATDEGAQVINLSLGGAYPSTVLQNAIDYAIARDVWVIAAAGNTGGSVLWPAAYEPVVAVGSVDQNLERSSFSSYGPEIDLWAPGRDMVVTANEEDYEIRSGTSFAAPYVAGIAVVHLTTGWRSPLFGESLHSRGSDSTQPNVMEESRDSETQSLVPSYPNFKMPYANYEVVYWTGGPHGYNEGYDFGGTYSFGDGSGLDFSNGTNFEVLAMADGRVVEADCSGNGAFGCVVAVQHVGNTVIIYAHLKIDSIDVSVGQNVIQGNSIGRAGNTGCIPTPEQPCRIHLHIDLRAGKFTDGNENGLKDTTESWICTRQCVGTNNIGGDPIGWDVDLNGVELVDGYQIRGYVAAVDIDGLPTSMYNYDGSAVVGGGWPRGLFNPWEPGYGFQYRDYKNPEREPVQVWVGEGYLCTAYKESPDTADCENPNSFTSPNSTLFAVEGRIYSLPGQSAASQTQPQVAVMSASTTNYLISTNQRNTSVPNPSDSVPPTGSWITPSDRTTISSSNMTLSATASDNVGGSGVREVRFSALWNGVWAGVGSDTTPPYSVSWDWCTANVPNGDVELGMEVWDNAGNKWIYSEHYPNIHVTKNADCGGGGTPGDWTASYYTGINRWFDNSDGSNLRCTASAGGPELIRDYGDAAPCSGMTGDLWVGDYQATVNFPSGNYVFWVEHDDSLKLWLNQQNIADRGDRGSGWVCPARPLSGNVNLRAMLREDFGQARAKVQWFPDTGQCNTANLPSWLLEWSKAEQPPLEVDIHIRVQWEPGFDAFRICFDGQNCQETSATELYYTWNTYGWPDGFVELSVEYRRLSDNQNWANALRYTEDFYLSPSRGGVAPCDGGEGATLQSGSDCIRLTESHPDLSQIGWADRSNLIVSVSGPYEAWVYDGINYRGTTRVVRSGESQNTGGNVSSIRLDPPAPTIPPLPTSPFICTSSTFALYHFDEGSGNSVLNSCGSPNGTKDPAVNWTGGRFGPALSFTNPPDGRGVTLGTFNVCPMSVELWVRRLGEGRVAGQMGGNGNTGQNKWLIKMLGNTPWLEIWSAGGSRETPSFRSINDDAWHLLMFTYDCANTGRLYLDNELVATLIADAVWPSGSTTFEIGSTEGIYRFQGDIDEVRISSGVRVPQSPPPAAEREALVALYNSTNGPNWANTYGWLVDESVCRWYGVTCNANGNVTQLNLSGNGLVGTLPVELGNLDYLEDLNLSSRQDMGIFFPPFPIPELYNQLSGELPASLGNLSRLRRLSIQGSAYFGGNQLSGSIPAEMGNLGDLTYLNLGGNQLAGSIPVELGGLTNLTYLDLSRNQLAGSIPVELGGLTNLAYLGLGTNQLAGTIPAELGDLANLTQLALGPNQLSGSIPSELGNLTSLTTLQIARNRLSGSIPLTLGNLSNLTSLYLNENQLTGPIPPELGNLANLTTLSLATNQLTGSIPTELGNLSNLFELSLDGNRLVGSIPPELGALSSLAWLHLERNQLTGSIPPELGNLTNLQVFSVGYNQLSGDIPDLSTLTNLATIDFQANKLSGPLPTWLNELSNLTYVNLFSNNLTGPIPDLSDLNNLETLDLGYNQLSGSIPDLRNTNLRFLNLTANQLTGVIPPLANLRSLTFFSVASNQLTGPIPPEFGNLAGLYNLHLERNQLTGSIPRELGNLAELYVLQLGDNQLSGEIPPELGNLTGLWGLYLYNNQLTGTIPPELGNLSSTGLQYLRLDNNQLTGSIPSSLGNLSALQYLYLNHNQLSSSIPPELGNLSNLLYLQLAENQLSGPIPGELGNLSNLSHLWLSWNDLSGAIPPALGALQNLRYFYLWDNQLTGSIPPELGNLTNLQVFSVGYNQLSGAIPPELRNLTLLRALHLNDNQLSGEIPDLSSLTNLVTIDLQINQISGSVPAWLNGLPNLTYLNLFYNRLTGPIPDLGALDQMTTLSLALNQLTGEVPAWLNELQSLTNLDLGGNQLSGDVPDISNLTALRMLGLNINQLTGSIPDFSNLIGLNSLNLSNNQFTGEILSSLGTLVNLQTLNVSNNQLTGSIPAEIGNLAALTTFNVSGNALQGSVPETITALTNLTSLDIGYNRLVSNSAVVSAFLGTLNPDWRQTQTVPPTDVTVTGMPPTGMGLSWTPILYTDDGGYYEVRYSTTAGGPYEDVGCTTDSKTDTGCLLENLTPDTDYYLVIRAFTPAHTNNPRNDLWSDLSAEITASLTTENSAPELTLIGNQSVDEGQTVNVAVTGSDLDGDALTLTVTDLPTFASFVDNGNGSATLTLSPTFADAGSYEITVTVSDGTLNDSETITVTVNNVNQAPTLEIIGALEVDEGDVLEVTLSASDPENARITYIFISLPTFASFIDNGDGTGVLSIAPGYNSAGRYFFTVIASDADGEQASETVSLTINDINRAPELEPIGDRAVDEGQSLTVNIAASDPDSNPLLLAAQGLPEFATFTDNGDGTGTLALTPTFEDAGSYDITITVSDGDLTDSETFTVIVNTVTLNRDPQLTLSAEPLTVDEGQTAARSFSASDLDGDSLTLTAPIGTITAQGGDSYTWSLLAEDGPAAEAVTITVEDGQGGSAQATFALTVNNVPPTAMFSNQSGSITAGETAQLVFSSQADPSAVDTADGFRYSYACMLTGDFLVTQSTSATFNCTYMQAGTFTARGRIEDRDGGFSDYTVEIEVQRLPNQAPILTLNTDPLTVDEGQTAARTFSASDLDGDSLTLTASAGSITAQGSDSYTWSLLAEDGPAVETITITVEDGQGGSTQASFTLTVNNLPPMATFSTNISGPVEIGATVMLMFTNQSDPGAADNAAGFSYAFDCGGDGVFEIEGTLTPSLPCTYASAATYAPRARLYDRDGAFTEYSTQVVVNPAPNNVPIATADSASTQEGVTVTINVLANDSDADADPLAIASIMQPANGQAVITGAVISYTPNTGFSGTDTFTYTVSDGKAQSLPAIVTVTVIPSGTPQPFALTRQVNQSSDDVNEDGNQYTATNPTVWLGNGLSRNQSFTGMRFTGISIPQGATIDEAYLEVYSPYGGWMLVSLDIAAEAADNSVTFSRQQRPSQRTRTAAHVQDVSNTQWTAGTWNRLPNIAAVLQEVVNRPGWQSGNSLSLIIQGTGSPYGRKFVVSYNADPAFAPRLVINFTAAAANIPPVALNDDVTIDEDVPVIVPVLSNDSDLNGDVLTITGVTQGALGTVTTDGRTITYTPNPNTSGPDTFDYTIADGQGGSAGAAVRVQINPVNDVPVAADDTATAYAGASITIPVLGNDSDVEGDLLTITTVTQGASGTVVTDGRTITYTPNAGFSGVDSFSYTIEDGQGGAASATVSVTVLADDRVTATYQIAASADDVNEDGGSFSATAPTLWLGTGRNAGQSFTGLRFAGVSIPPGATVTDAYLEVYSAAGSWIALGLEFAGEAAADSAPFSGGSRPSARTLTAARAVHESNIQRPVGTWSRFDGLAPLVQEVVNQPGWVAGNDLSLIARGLYGSWARIFAASYDGNPVNAARLVVVYTPLADIPIEPLIVVNELPVALDDSASTPADTPVVIPVMGNDSDADGDLLTVTAVTQGANGTVVTNGRTVTYTPNAGFSGTDSFSYTISDGRGGEASAVVTVTVTAPPPTDEPTVVPSEEPTPLPPTEEPSTEEPTAEPLTETPEPTPEATTEPAAEPPTETSPDTSAGA